MVNNSILEIGTEEIPAKLVNQIHINFTDKAKELLNEYRIDFNQIEVYGAPRRIAVELKGISEYQKQEVNEIKGPPKNIAFDEEGNPTKAIKGFAKGLNIDISELEERETERGIYLYAVVESDQKKTKELLQEIYPRLITEVKLPITMRWGKHDLKFIRPIHWFLALYNNQKIKFELKHLKSNNKTKGHRFLANKQFVVNSVKDYKKVLRNAYVIVDPEERKEIIKKEIDSIIKENNLKLNLDYKLLTEVTHLVEYPRPFLASFDKKYLRLPEPVIVTPLKEHQKYFPLWNNDGKLSNKFIVVKDGGKEYIKKVRIGNEKVLKARLEDADFYFKRDIEVGLDVFLKKLKGLILREELGNMYDKTLRNVKLSKKIAINLNLDNKEINKIEKAAKYAKVDLVSQMVREFPELQGVMGGIYAKKHGFDQEIANIIQEHYLPDSADSKLPTTKAAKIISLSDKIDTLTGFFGIDLIPTGSQDPYGLRRAAIGIYRLIDDLNYEIEIEKLFELSLDVYKSSGKKLKPVNQELIDKIHDFMLDRIQYIFKDEGYDVDIIRTVIYGLPLSVPLIKRALRLFDDIKEEESFKEFLTAFNRVDSIIKDVKINNINQDLFQKMEEKQLFERYKVVKHEVDKHIQNKDLDKAYQSLIKIIEPIHDFFEEVRVMSKDKKIKENRLTLLKNIQQLMKRIGDFSFKQ
ncbi:MAG: glycine--tRNA ligase subunit beta [Halanaerobiales bacterium]|nr:glycine--tRNA ligase subunit beta [Halanaerobiales bacterium]